MKTSLYRRRRPERPMDAAVTTRASPRAELKYYTLSLTTNFSSVSTTPVVVDLTGLISQGLDTTGRIGKAIYVRDIVLEGTLEGGQSNLATDDNHNTIRLLLAGGTPQTLATSLISFWSVGSYLSPAFNGLDRVYRDISFSLQSPGRDSVGYMPAIRQVRLIVPVGRWIRYAGSGVGVASFNTIVMAMCSDSAVASNPGFNVGQVTVRFTDE